MKPMTKEELRRWRGKRTRREVAALIEKTLRELQIRESYSVQTYRSHETPGRCKTVPVWMRQVTKLVGKKTSDESVCAQTAR